MSEPKAPTRRVGSLPAPEPVQTVKADSRGILRNPDGTLAQGNRAGGRPALPEGFREAVDGVKTKEGVHYLYRIMAGEEDVPADLRIRVTQWAFERVYGKAPPAPLEPEDTAELTPAVRALLALAMVEGGPRGE